MASIREDKFIVFSSHAVDAVKAASEIDNVSFVYVETFESVIMVTTATKGSYSCSKMDEQFKQVENILNKYNIEYKYKKF